MPNEVDKATRVSSISFIAVSMSRVSDLGRLGGGAAGHPVTQTVGHKRRGERDAKALPQRRMPRQSGHGVRSRARLGDYHCPQPSHAEGALVVTDKIGDARAVMCLC